MSAVTTSQSPNLTDEQIDHILDAMADSFGQQLHAPILCAPSEQDLEYEDVTFPALDGVQLQGWFIPASGSDNTSLPIVRQSRGRSGKGVDASGSFLSDVT